MVRAGRVISLSIIITALAAIATAQPTPKSPVVMPSYFEVNRGQLPPDVRFIARTNCQVMYLTDHGFTVTSTRATKTTDALTVLFENAQPTSSIEGTGVLKGTANYLRPGTMITRVPLYSGVMYRNLYPGIDARFYLAGQGIEYDLLLAPLADSRAIRLRAVNGAARLGKRGEAVFTSMSGLRITQMSPTIYQEERGQRLPVSGKYILHSDGAVSLDIGRYERSRQLVIDPLLNYSTMIPNVDDIASLAVDALRNVYITGTTRDLNFPTTPGAFSPTYHTPAKYGQSADAYVMKFDAKGTLVFATYLGGNETDNGKAIAADDDGVYVAGVTSPGWLDGATDPGPFFPTKGYHTYPYKNVSTVLSGPDVFVVKLSTDGTALRFSAQIAGSMAQAPTAIAIDEDRSVYVTGWVTTAVNATATPFPTSATAYQRQPLARATHGAPGGNKATFLLKLRGDGNALLFSTLFGGSWQDIPASIAVDGSKNVWICGTTTSGNLPTTADAFSKSYTGTITQAGTSRETRNTNGFVAEFNATGSALLYSSYLSSTNSNAASITTDIDDNAYVVGNADADYHLVGKDLWDVGSKGGAFLTKLTAARSVDYSIFLGPFSPSVIATNNAAVVVAGTTTSSSFPVRSPYQATLVGSADACLMRLNDTATTLEFSTYLGGSTGDGANAMALDSAGNVFLAGDAYSPNFPVTAGAFHQPGGNETHNFYCEFNFDKDGDGLLDTWETAGIDVDGDGTVDLDLPALGAKVDHKDLFVEADYMGTINHTHKPVLRPDSTAILARDPLAAVTATFASAPVTNPDNTNGINLHILLDEQLPEITPITVGTSASDFERLKNGTPKDPCGAAHFGTQSDRNSANCSKIIKAKRMVYRYCIFGHDFIEGGSIGGSGRAEIGGNDFVVTLRVHGQTGQMVDYEQNAKQVAATFGTSFDDEFSDMISGTFMHELGHTLGLHHGGGKSLDASSREINCKPNYISVMNYTRQLNLAGRSSVGAATVTRINRALDYSRAALPTLNESSLSEPAGVGGNAGVLVLSGIGGVPHAMPAAGAIDWNGANGVESTPVAADINAIAARCGGPSPGQVLEGHDDWANIIYSFRGSREARSGLSFTAAVTDGEPTAEEVSGPLLGTAAPSISLSSPADGQQFGNMAAVPITATASDADGAIVAVEFMDGEAIIATRTAAPYSYSWLDATSGAHHISARAIDDKGAATRTRSVAVSVGCAMTTTPGKLSLSSVAGSASIALSTGANCEWALIGGASWLEVAPSTGVGSQTIVITLERNTSPIDRSTTLQLGDQSVHVTQAGGQPFGAPGGVLAESKFLDDSTPVIHVAWSPVSEADHYEVAYSSNGSTFVSGGGSVEPFFDLSNSSLAMDTAYLLSVRAVRSDGSASAYSAADLATTTRFTDSPLVPGQSVIKASHIVELRRAVGAVRALAGLQPATWTDAIVGGGFIRAIHVAELRTSIDAARSALGLPSVAYSYSLPAAGSIIHAADIEDIRKGTQ